MNIFKREVVTCFKCEGIPGRYIEFIASGMNKERQACPCCKESRYTVPNSYMRKMGLADFQNLLEVMEKITGIKPLHVLTFTSMNLPDAIVIQRKRGA